MKALETVLSFYEALNSDHALVALDLVADDASWTEMFPGLRGTWTGPDAVRRNVFEPLGHEWENFEISTESFVAEGSTVVAFGTYSGMYKGPENPSSPLLFIDGRSTTEKLADFASTPIPT